MKKSFAALLVAFSLVLISCGQDCVPGYYNGDPRCAYQTMPYQGQYPYQQPGQYAPGQYPYQQVPGQNPYQQVPGQYPYQQVPGQYPYQQPNPYTYPCSPSNPYCYR